MLRGVKEWAPLPGDPAGQSPGHASEPEVNKEDITAWIMVNWTLTEEAWGDEETGKTASGVWGAEKGPHAGDQTHSSFLTRSAICQLVLPS